MKVCAVCSEIVSQKQGCDRSDCPNRGVDNATAPPVPEVGLTGKADHAVQTGIDGLNKVSRETTRSVIFILIFILSLTVSLVALGFRMWAPSENPKSVSVTMSGTSGLVPATPSVTKINPLSDGTRSGDCVGNFVNGRGKYDEPIATEVFINDKNYVTIINNTNEPDFTSYMKDIDVDKYGISFSILSPKGTSYSIDCNAVRKSLSYENSLNEFASFKKSEDK